MGTLSPRFNFSWCCVIVYYCQIGERINGKSQRLMYNVLVMTWMHFKLRVQLQEVKD